MELRGKCHLLYMDDLKLQGRNENELKNEMKIVQTISKDMNMNSGLEKCARICLKRGSVQSKMHVGSTFDDIKELDPRIIPVIIGATGIVTRSLKKNLETVPGNHSIDSLQKTAILGTSHIIRKVLQCEA